MTLTRPATIIRSVGLHLAHGASPAIQWTVLVDAGGDQFRVSS
jgi:hypothetical protein